MFILLGLCSLYVTFGNVPFVYALFNGLKPAVIAIVLLAVIKIGKKSLISPFHYFVAFAAFVCIFFLNIPFPFIIIGAIGIAAIARHFSPIFFVVNNNANKQNERDENDFYSNKDSVVATFGFSLRRLAKQVGLGILLWLLPFIAFYFLTNDFDFWKKLSLFFTQAALVTFGGAYAVLPYVAQVSVEEFKWLTNLEMIDGLALGETTPGPLIMVLVFVGFMAGFNNFGGSIAMGMMGLFTTTFYTFLPCFLFIFIGAPIIERTQENKTVKEILGIVTAAVVGVIINLIIYLGKAVIFPTSNSIGMPDYSSLVWIVISLVALYRFKLNMIIWIVISAIFGLVSYLLAN